MPRKKERLVFDASPRAIAGWPARGANTSAGSHQQDSVEEFNVRPLRTSRRWSVNLPSQLYGKNYRLRRSASHVPGQSSPFDEPALSDNGDELRGLHLPAALVP